METFQQEKQITIVSADGERRVPLSVLADEDPRIAEQITSTPLPMDQMHHKLRQALEKNGYTSREKVVELVREVRQEMLAEQESNQATGA
ncbi:MAG: hypothetical protein AAGA46_07730 [Cyanobacteria bacterium P01_F01_bin.13]